jgi:hypothetical protein
VVVIVVVIAIRSQDSSERALSFPIDELRIGQAHVGEVSLVGMGSARRDITVSHAEPLLSADSVPAAASVLICHSRTPNYSLGHMDGWASLSELCEKVVPATGARVHALRLGQTFDYFVLALTPLVPGRLTLRGIEVTHGDTTERSGSLVKVNALPSAG